MWQGWGRCGQGIQESFRWEVVKVKQKPGMVTYTYNYNSGNGGRRIELEASLGYIPRNLFGRIRKIEN